MKGGGNFAIQLLINSRRNMVKIDAIAFSVSKNVQYACRLNINN